MLEVRNVVNYLIYLLCCRRGTTIADEEWFFLCLCMVAGFNWTVGNEEDTLKIEFEVCGGG